jgi:hypothetical protein
MRRTLIVALAGGATLVAAPAAWASTPTDGPYSYSGPDSGTCHPYDAAYNEVPWALDLGTRSFTTPAADPSGDYSIVETFSGGRFISKADPGPNGPGSVPAAGPKVIYSPGACDNGTDDGHRLREGVSGTFSGSEHLFIQGGTYSAGDGTCAGEDSTGAPMACTTDNYVAYHYGSSATTTLTSYRFDYYSFAMGVKGTWQKGKHGGHYTDIGTSSAGQNWKYTELGDIYTSTVTVASHHAVVRHDHRA